MIFFAADHEVLVVTSGDVTDHIIDVVDHAVEVMLIVLFLEWTTRFRFCAQDEFHVVFLLVVVLSNE